MREAETEKEAEKQTDRHMEKQRKRLVEISSGKKKKIKLEIKQSDRQEK